MDDGDRRETIGDRRAGTWVDGVREPATVQLAEIAIVAGRRDCEVVDSTSA